jgi:Skp family chaperone for outer membrane proteins
MSANASSTVPSHGVFDASHVKGEFNQYWYSKNTIEALMQEVTHHATACAFLSTPSLFFALDRRRGDESADEDARLQELRKQSRLFEYDTQWASDPCYVQYDFHYPERVPVQYMAAFDYVVADPPFITGDVWERYIATVKLLLRDGGKLLFTTVLENHIMLENLMDRPLFIAAFYPLVEHLTYQYVCFLSYEPTVLSRPNPEVQGEVDPKMIAAIQMANDLRASEKEFALQMATRRRDGEARLPTAAYERDMQLAQDPVARQKAEEEQRRGVDWDSIPIEKMEWGHIPEGLTMYPDGNVPPPPSSTSLPGDNGNAAAAVVVVSESCRPEYDACLRLRTDLDEFKGYIDAMQRHMDAQMKLRRQRVKLTKELAALQASQGGGNHAGRSESDVEQEKMVSSLQTQVAEVTAAVSASEEERAAKLDTMSQLAARIEEEEHALATLQASSSAPSPAKEVPYAAVMADCIAAYRTVEAKKVPLQELAADATGRYKFPIFARMKELLQRIKELKQA